MVRKLALAMLLVCGGCQGQRCFTEARIAVAETFLFAQIDRTDHRRETPPSRQPVGGGEASPASCPPPHGRSGRHFKKRDRKKWFNGKYNRAH